MIVVGNYGKDNDRKVFQRSLFYHKLVDSQPNILGTKPLQGRDQQIPHVVI